LRPWEAHVVVYMLISPKISQNTLWFGSWLLIMIRVILFTSLLGSRYDFLHVSPRLRKEYYNVSLTLACTISLFPFAAHWVASRVAVRPIHKWPSRLCSLCCRADRDRGRRRQLLHHWSSLVIYTDFFR
jgi:hypothetical protein